MCLEIHKRFGSSEFYRCAVNCYIIVSVKASSLCGWSHSDLTSSQIHGGITGDGI